MFGVRKVYLVSRTRERGVAVERDFPGLEFMHFGALGEVKGLVPLPGIVVGCVPADEIGVGDIPVGVFEWGAGVEVEVAYRPLVMALMKVAGAQEGWKCVGGTEVLKEQVYHQFKMWTGRKAPSEIMAEAMDRVVKGRM